MKNKVDISKLIKEKYKDNTLELSDIFEEIDLVLQEGFSYETKNADPANMEEISMEKYASAIVNGAGDPRQEKSDVDQTRYIAADKIAQEASEVPSKEVAFNIPVMDLFSMITNSKMQLGSPDRDLINDIVQNMGGTPGDDWKARIKLLQNYTNKLSQPQAQTGDMSNVISTLIYLNLLKKLSYFTAQPGKQFEYVIAPLISPVAQVPPDDSDIADIKLSGGKSFGIKFFSAKSPTFRGSLKNLRNHPNGLNYIIGKTFANGVVEFGELLITSNLNDIQENEYSYVPDLSEASSRREIAFFVSKSGASPKLKCYAINEKGGRIEDKNFDTVQSQKVKGPKKETSDLQKLTLLKKQLEGSIRKIKSIIDQTIFNKIQKDTKPFNSQQFATIRTEIEKWAPEISNLKSYLDNFEKSPQTGDLKVQQDFLKPVMQLLRGTIQAIDNQIENQPISENLNLSQEAKKEQEVQPQLPSEGQFLFNVPSKLWQYMRVDYLELGDPNIYNSQMLKISDSVSKKYVQVLENLKELNENLTNYFATSAEKQAANVKSSKDPRGFAERSIDNANKIVDGVVDIKAAKD